MGDPDNEADDPWKGMEIERELKSREDPRGKRPDDDRPDDDRPRRVRQREDDND